MFPGARFANIVRNPYRVYQSMLNMYGKILPAQAFQELDWDEIEAWMVAAYQRVMGRYLEERKHLPEGSLFEIRYEELDKRPLEVLRNLYDALALGDFDAVRPRIEAYLRSLGTFKKNRFDFPAELVEKVNEHWGFALDAFGYERLEPGQTPA